MAFKYIAKQIYFNHNRALSSNFQLSKSLYSLRLFSSYTKLEMPALSPTMEDGTISKWLKKEGDKINVGDLICDIQTDKATVGFESQEEGYLAKILVPNNMKGVKIGQVIGVMVDGKEDLNSKEVLDYVTQHQSGAKKDQQTVKENQPSVIKQGEQVKKQEQHDNGYDQKLHTEIQKVRCSPASIANMRLYYILPSELKGSGFKNMITKTDVLLYVKSKGLQKGQKRETEVKVEPKKLVQQAQQATQQKKVQKQEEYNSKNPLKQSWQDIQSSDVVQQIGANIQFCKSAQPHQYLSIYCSVDQILKNLEIQQLDPAKTFDNFMIKASTSVLRKIFKSQDLDAKRVYTDGKESVQFFVSPNHYVVSQIKGVPLETGAFAAETPGSLLTVYQLDNAIDSLPITNQHSLITLHYTKPIEEVDLDVGISERFFDITETEEKPISYDLKLKRTKKVKVSVSFNVQKVDQDKAVAFISKLQDILSDPDLFLL